MTDRQPQTAWSDTLRSGEGTKAESKWWGAVETEQRADAGVLVKRVR